MKLVKFDEKMVSAALQRMKKSLCSGRSNDSSCRTGTRADPSGHEGLSDPGEEVLESMLPLLAPSLNGISQGSFRRRKTYNSRCPVKADTESVLSAAQGPLVFIIMKIFWGDSAEFVLGNHSALSAITEKRNKKISPSQEGEHPAGSNVCVPLQGQFCSHPPTGRGQMLAA